MSIAGTLAQDLLACYQAELNAGPNPPAQICLRAGGDVGPSLGTSTDECCAGLAWVRIVSVITLRQDASAPDFNECIVERRVELEMGAARCMPFGTTQLPPTCEQWTAVALQLDADSDAMFKAACCLRGDQEFGGGIVTLGTYTAEGPDGNCIGGTMSVFIDIQCGVC